MNDAGLIYAMFYALKNERGFNGMLEDPTISHVDPYISFDLDKCLT